MSDFATLPIEELVAAIDVNYGDGIPEEALLAARDRRDEIVPHLIGLIRRETELVRNNGEPTPTSGSFAALLLLTEFSAKEALPAIVESLRLPDDQSYIHWGDAVTELMGRILAELASDATEVIDGLISDPAVDEFVRRQAAQTFVHFVRDGLMTRDVAVARLRDHLSRALASADDGIVSCLVSELGDLLGREAQAEINLAIERELADEFDISAAEMAAQGMAAEVIYQTHLELCPPTGVADAISELHRWFDRNWSDGGKVDLDPEWDASDDAWNVPAYRDEPDAEPTATIFRDEARVGRNGPCLCGSGKKYKKCCGRNP